MRKYRTIARIHLMHSLQYRANLLGGFAMYAMFLFVFFCLWRTIYATGTPEAIAANPDSITGRYLMEDRKARLRRRQG